MIELCCEYLSVRCKTYGAFDCMFFSCNVRVSEWIHTLWFPNVKELLAQNRLGIYTFNDYNWTWTHNSLVCKQMPNHLVKLAKWFSCVLRTYLYGKCDCKLLSCHVRVSKWIHSLLLPESKGTPCSKKAWNVNFTWLQQDWNPQPLSLLKNPQLFS